MSCINC